MEYDWCVSELQEVVARGVLTEFDNVGCEMNGNNGQFYFPNEKMIPCKVQKKWRDVP